MDCKWREQSCQLLTSSAGSRRSLPPAFETEVASFVPPAAMPQMADAAEVTRAVRTAHPKLHVVTLAPIFAERRTPGCRCPVHHHARVRQRGAQSGECPSDPNGSGSRSRARRGVGSHPRRQRTPHRGGISTAFGCSLQGLVPENEVLSLATALAEAGVDAVALADTLGYGTHPRSAGSCGRCVQKSASNDWQFASARHARFGTRQRSSGTRGGCAWLRRGAGRPWRLSLCTWLCRQRLYRRSRLPAGIGRLRYRDRP